MYSLQVNIYYQYGIIHALPDRLMVGHRSLDPVILVRAQVWQPMKKKYFVYILECSDSTLYIGITNDLDKRIIDHNTSKKGAKYTRGRRPVTLKYKEELPSKSLALKREASLKKLSRKEKLFLTCKV